MSAARALIERITAELQDLPEETLAEVLDFVGYLRQKRQWEERSPDAPKRGSAEALLKAIDEYPLLFEPGEMEEILADIEEMREME